MNAKKFNINTDNNPTWLTPPSIIKALGKFDLDPCTPFPMPWKTADRMLSIEQDGDGLAADWGTDRIWLNPPYGKETFKWLAKLAEHPRGGTALIFARTETKGFHQEIWQKATAVFFFEGRLSFHYQDGEQAKMNGGAPSCLIAYGKFDHAMIVMAMRKGLIKGRLIGL